jgi:HEAT repeat protein
LIAALQTTRAIAEIQERALRSCLVHSEAEPVLRAAEEVIVSRIAHNLGRLGDAAASDALLDALEAHPYPGCITALAALKEPRAIPRVVECLYDDFARSAAADALRAFGQRAVPFLERLLLVPHVQHGFEGPTWTAPARRSDS